MIRDTATGPAASPYMGVTPELRDGLGDDSDVTSVASFGRLVSPVEATAA
jgi:hypothetical protein